MSEQQFRVDLGGGKILGPVDVRGLRDLAKRGLILAQTRIEVVGRGWVIAGTVKGLVPLIAQASAPKSSESPAGSRPAPARPPARVREVETARGDNAGLENQAPMMPTPIAQSTSLAAGGMPIAPSPASAATAVSIQARRRLAPYVVFGSIAAILLLGSVAGGVWFFWGRSGASFQRAADHLQNAIRARDHAECMQGELEYAQAVVRLAGNLRACAEAGKFSDQEYLVIVREVVNRKYLGGDRDESTFLFANGQLLAALEITKLNGYGDDLPAFVRFWQTRLAPDADAFVEQSYKKHPEIASQVLRTMAAMSRKR